jgi:hypothetical protein
LCCNDTQISTIGIFIIVPVTVSNSGDSKILKLADAILQPTLGPAV